MDEVLRAVANTWQPRLANSAAMLYPMPPEEQPVISTTAMSDYLLLEYFGCFSI